MTRRLEILSEARRSLPDALKVRHPQIPWAEMAAAGNVDHHNFENVQRRLVRGTVKNRFAALLAVVDRKLDALQPDSPRPQATHLFPF